MALIKCSECGQMVSDKAAACPHCGCPVEKLMACPECGHTIEVGESYCKNCGCPLASDTVEQSANIPNQNVAQEYYCSEDDERGNNRLWIWFALAALALIGGTAAWLNWQNGITKEISEAMDTVAVVEELPLDSTAAIIVDDEPEVEHLYAEAETELGENDTYNDNYENADIEEGKSWIQGNWRYRMVTEFGAMETRIGISGEYIVEMMNGEMTYSGEYAIDGDHLSYNHTYIIIDRASHRLMADETHPFKRF